jgi:hypothetical protein
MMTRRAFSTLLGAVGLSLSLCLPSFSEPEVRIDGKEDWEVWAEAVESHMTNDPVALRGHLDGQQPYRELPDVIPDTKWQPELEMPPDEIMRWSYSDPKAPDVLAKAGDEQGARAAWDVILSDRPRPMVSDPMTGKMFDQAGTDEYLRGMGFRV